MFPFLLSRIIISGLLLGIVLSVCICWFDNMVTLPPWLVFTDFGTCSYQSFLSNCTPVSFHIIIIIFTADNQDIKVYVWNLTVKTRKIRTRLNWQRAYYSHALHIVLSARYVTIRVWRFREWSAVTVSGEGLSGEIRWYGDEITFPIQGVPWPTEQLSVS